MSTGTGMTAPETAAADAEGPLARAPGAGGNRLVLALDDCAAMTVRNVRKVLRAPDQVSFTFIAPIMFTLLFRYVFGGAIRGLGHVSYVDYLVPGIAVQQAFFSSGNAGFAIADDRQKGFVDRLRSLPMARSAVLVGHVAATAVFTAVSLVITTLVGLAVGLRPGSVGGLVAGLLLGLAFASAVSWLFALVGLYASNSQAVNAITFPLIFPLTFASSAFVPTATMPSWLRVFADNQPVTLVIDAVRDLLIGDIGPAQRALLFAGRSTTTLVVESLLWAVGIAVVFGVLAVRRYNATTS
ncbi:MAG TPA: ABC transporter permease [Acidimicrobiales bacterium]|nr:ABC transporter permease [Acidimicrobiales bacterium]